MGEAAQKHGTLSEVEKTMFNKNLLLATSPRRRLGWVSPPNQARLGGQNFGFGLRHEGELVPFHRDLDDIALAEFAGKDAI
jgi:hypothetical protein